jgi:hypothetical protein
MFNITKLTHFNTIKFINVILLGQREIKQVKIIGTVLHTLYEKGNFKLVRQGQFDHDN